MKTRKMKFCEVCPNRRFKELGKRFVIKILNNNPNGKRVSKYVFGFSP